MDDTETGRLSRRRLLRTAGGTGLAGLVAGGAASVPLRNGRPVPLTAIGATAVLFHGARQAGITTRAQAVGHLVAFDLAAGADRRATAALLRRWSDAAAAMTAGRTPDDDDQIALDAGPCALTVTFGFGRTLFPKIDREPPAGLAPLPPFAADALDPRRGGGDLWIQIGADDAPVAFHALRTLQRRAAGTARIRWQMSGFNRARGATDRPRTARNLMGQIDGTRNPRPGDTGFDAAIFVGPDAPDTWMRGGSYAVVRRIRMLLDDWDRLPLDRQEKVIGRRKANGAPLSGGTETTAPDLVSVRPDGSPAIPADAHVRVAAPESNGGATMLRRSFSYHDGLRPDGTPDAGLLFVAWQADPTTGFVQVQRKLDGADHLTRFIRHESSAVFAVPPGAEPGDYVGRELLET
ncbi:iron uptake transporter deferrochelatase/peroxidase subunit [Actinomadura rayongensis]|uniref:Deferrochelatase n=1 Tax=Actinomadura rayongensis TaxID=1429076 RepID=A0A6I4WB35_9ACTN|nr:iron uptake transporter deferrochelatase/peroxidase subunit [Actinomadura rayongensis]MXQ64274.1 deferrochelatase/peroxidase EfeB [Actinomadura rayongensis]